MNVYYFHAIPVFIFFLQNTGDPDQPAPYLFSSLLVDTCSLITDKKLGEIQCIVYKIIQSIIS